MRALSTKSAGEAPAALDALLPPFVARGVCLVLPGHRMPVPIPLDECLVTAGNQLLWATGHTIYGPSRPQVGHLEFATWQFGAEVNGGCELLNQQGEVIARLVRSDTLALPAARAGRLKADFARHRQRISADATYASRWARGLREIQRANALRP